MSPRSRRHFALAFGITLLAASDAGAAAPGRITVAIAYFDDNTGKPDLASLGKGLADMLITDLGGVSSLQIVERDRLNQVLAELKLGKSRFIDPKTAQKLGKGLAAAYILTGAYTLVGDTLRIDCRVVRVTTGAVAASAKAEGAKADFFALEKELVDLLLRTLDIKLAGTEQTRLRRNQTQSFEALRSYAAGLDALDRGDDERAGALFRVALEADPGYTSAKNASERLKAIFKRTDDDRARLLDKTFASLDPKTLDFGARVDELLAGYQSSDGMQLGKKVALLHWLALRDLTPSSGGVARAPLEILALLSRYLEDPSQATVIPAVCEYVVTRYPGYAGGQPQCKAYLSALDAMTKARAEHPGALKYPSLEERRKGRTLDWEVALLDNEPATLRLFALYAKKVRRP